jgi:hypothetical protein
MTHFFALIWAKLSYRFSLETDAAKTLINAGLASKREAEKRAYAEQLEREAADIEANIVREVETYEYKNLAGQEKYEADKEKRDAERVIEDKRATAKQDRKPRKARKMLRRCSERTPRTLAP